MVDDDPHERLGAAVRALTDLVVRTGADAEAVRRAAVQVEALCSELAPEPARLRLHDSPFHPMSLVGGTAHPVAPQLTMAPSEEGDGVTGAVTLGPTFEGGPGLVHGGVVSLLFDHAMGQAVFLAGHTAMTVRLEVRYRRPTPLGAELRVTARVDTVERRKLHVSAELSAEGVVTAEAHALFLELTAANVADIFPVERVPRGSGTADQMPR